MSKGNISILLVLLSIVLLGGSYLYVFKPNMEDVDTLQTEVDNLQTRYNDLYEKSQHKQEYIDNTAKLKEDFAKELAYFPATLDQEVSVMFVKGLNVDEGAKLFDVGSVGLGMPEQFYALGAATTNPDGSINTAGATYVAYKAEFPLNYSGSYDGLKNFIDYVMAYKYRMNLSSMAIAYDSNEDVYTGSVLMNAYCVAGGDREGDKISVDVKNGVDNIFLGGEGAVSTTSFSYDADNGAAIVSNNDISIVLNNANNDSTDGIIVSSGASDTYVTSADNSVQTLVITITEEGGKNYVTYAIGDKSYKKEITSSDLKVYVKSSSRVDSADTNGVKVTVDNKTSLPVFFKVDGDDATSPRFTLGSKNGTVKVY